MKKMEVETAIIEMKQVGAVLDSASDAFETATSTYDPDDIERAELLLCAAQDLFKARYQALVSVYFK